MSDEKIRIRTEEELESRQKCFLEIVNILEKNNIHFLFRQVLCLEREEMVTLLNGIGMLK